MKAVPNVPFVHVAVAALVMLLGAFVADWMLLSPIHGQEEGGDPTPNQELIPQCKGDLQCSQGCMDSRPPCPRLIKGLPSCHQPIEICALCVCTPVQTGPGEWSCTCK